VHEKNAHRAGGLSLSVWLSTLAISVNSNEFKQGKVGKNAIMESIGTKINNSGNRSNQGNYGCQGNPSDYAYEGKSGNYGNQDKYTNHGIRANKVNDEYQSDSTNIDIKVIVVTDVNMEISAVNASKTIKATILGWVGPRAGLEAEVRGKILCLCRGSNRGLPVRSQTLH
jgi:hypothetical protein